MSHVTLTMPESLHTSSSESDRYECHQVAHNQYTESKINRTFCFRCRKRHEKIQTHCLTKWLRPDPSFSQMISKIWVWPGEVESEWPSTRSLLSHWSRWQTGGSIFSPSIHHNGEFVVKPHLSHNGLEGGAVETCQLEWAGRSRGCGQRHSDTLSSWPDKKYLQTMIRWWD